MNFIVIETTMAFASDWDAYKKGEIKTESNHRTEQAAIQKLTKLKNAQKKRTGGSQWDSNIFVIDVKCNTILECRPDGYGGYCVY